MPFVDVPITTDVDALKVAALASLTANGWNPEDGDPEVVVIEAVTAAAQNAAEVAATVFPSIWRKFGTDLAGVAYLNGAAAEAEATFTLVDDGSPHTIPANTALLIGGVYFATVEDTDVLADVTSVPNVLVRAVDDGAAGNGLTGAAQLVNTLAWVSTVTFTTTTSGGGDAEDDDGYDARLGGEIQAAGPPVTDSDFAVKAFDTPGVVLGRATAVTTDVKTVTVSVTDINGLPLTSDDKTAISDYLQSKREVNFVVTVADATYNYVTVTYSFNPEAADGFVTSTTEANISDALRVFLNPATFGTPSGSDPLLVKPNKWSNETSVRLSRVMAIIQDTRGVNHVSATSVLINGSNADFSLTGTAPLPIIPPDVSFSAHTHTSTTVDTIADTSGLHVHMAVTGAGIPANTTITAVATNSITISNAATGAATVTLAATALIPTVI